MFRHFINVSFSISYTSATHFFTILRSCILIKAMLRLLGSFITVIHCTSNILIISGKALDTDDSKFNKFPSIGSPPASSSGLPSFWTRPTVPKNGDDDTRPQPFRRYYPEDRSPEIMSKAFIKLGMEPYILTAFPPNATTMPLYKWTIVANEDCMPELSCQIFNIAPPTENGECEDQYMEVTDGIVGIQRFCGRVGPDQIIASSTHGLRDLYVTFKNTLMSYPAKFECLVTCARKGEGRMMPQELQIRMNPKCVCGRKANKQRIIGGQTAYHGEFPWLAAMVVANTRQPYCIGSLINDRMILTAGHCFKGRFRKAKNTQVVLNGYIMDPMPNINVVKGPVKYMTYDPETLDMMDFRNNSYRYNVDKIWIHPHYNSENSDFDTAVMILSRPVDPNIFKDYSPICLPELTYDIDSYGGLTGVMAGWGLPAVDAPGTNTVLKQITVEIFKPNECAHYFGERFIGPRRAMCAAYHDSSQDSCAGDSGGPLTVEARPQVWHQVGIISWGDSCAVQGNPGVYFRTTSTNQWIQHISNSKEAVWCDDPDIPPF